MFEVISSSCHDQFCIRVTTDPSGKVCDYHNQDYFSGKRIYLVRNGQRITHFDPNQGQFEYCILKADMDIVNETFQLEYKSHPTAVSFL